MSFTLNRMRGVWSAHKKAKWLVEIWCSTIMRMRALGSDSESDK